VNVLNLPVGVGEIYVQVYGVYIHGGSTLPHCNVFLNNVDCSVSLAVRCCIYGAYMY
jgi:hypothetical protein